MGLEMDADRLTEFLTREFPQVADEVSIDAVFEDAIHVRLRVDDRHLRPGGTVSGPAIFALADVAFYLAIISRIGPKALAVTTNCAIDFMRKPSACTDLVAEARILKLGRVLVVGDALIRSDGAPSLVARASLTYSIPPDH